ncbi:hypothetical protein DSO57_1035892 [Entomophthora muscae]|uniref:Uncharacterized protein n=1 Tax=Entomophthora muscae TaxID=34485 RepID=A0ACC2TXP1_9FUNG|nr:hypothetical protein DSO57_1035892 [Entomophthora muscae]
MIVTSLCTLSLIFLPGNSNAASLFMQKDVFGGSQQWDTYDFLAVDDRLRGGSSQSYMEAFDSNNTAMFYGVLDTKTLGGAGFASQSVESPNVIFDFSYFSGLELSYLTSEKKYFTIDISNEYSAFLPNGSKPSTVEFQAVFTSEVGEAEGGGPQKVYLPFTDFTPVERGRPSKRPGLTLDLGSIRKVAFQLRSFFDQQSGPFSINLIKLTCISVPYLKEQN